MSADFDELREALRAFAQDLVDHAGAIVRDCGVAGGHTEAARAAVGKELLGLLAKLPPATPLTSPERIPPIVLRRLVDYRDHGLRPGPFLSAALAGDLYGALAQAAVEDRGSPDPVHTLAIPAIADWIKRELPGPAWGSYEYVGSWRGTAKS